MKNIQLKIKNENLKISKDLINAANNDELLARLFINRGINTKEKIDEILNWNKYKPFNTQDFQELKKSVDIIQESILLNEKIAIYGDYDVDGITATTILVKCLRKFTQNVIYHVPDRFTEGYGMNNDVIKSLARNDVKLIISCDCGISNVTEVETAKNLGLKVIITDHHTIPETLPPADVILNPKLFESEHIAYDLSGCGVAYFLCCAILKHYDREEEATQFLDLVALSIIADCVPLLKENRYLLKQGISRILKTDNIGLKSLCNTINSNVEISSDDIAFQIAPRINAAGRLDSARLPVELLLSEEQEKANLLADKINNLNIMRKDIQQRMIDDIMQIVETQKMHKNIIIAYNPDWHQGVIGIAAGKIAETYSKPVILLTLNQNSKTIVGSARSIADVNIYDLINNCSHHLIKFGGHPMAAGLSLDRHNLDKFIYCIEESSIKLLQGLGSTECYADQCIELTQINQELYDRISSLEPYGEGFEQPTFLTRNVMVLNDRITEKGHHFLTLTDDEQNIIPAVRWSGGKDSYKGATYDIIYNIYMDSYNENSLKISINNMVKVKDLPKANIQLSKLNIIDARTEKIDDLLKKYPQATIYFEGLGSHKLAYKTKNRETLKQSEILILLSIPANTEILKEIVHISNAKTLLINFSQNPEYSFNSFIVNTLGVIKHIINTKKGMATIQYMENLLCVEESILKNSFTYLRNYGKIEFEINDDSNLIIFKKPNYNPGRIDRLQTENHLINALHDKNAYKRYMQNIDIEDLYKLLSN